MLLCIKLKNQVKYKCFKFIVHLKVLSLVAELATFGADLVTFEVIKVSAVKPTCWPVIHFFACLLKT